MGKVSDLFKRWTKYIHFENPEISNKNDRSSETRADTFESWSGDNSPCNNTDSLFAATAVPGIMAFCERDEAMKILGLGEEDTKAKANKTKTRLQSKQPHQIKGR